MNPERRRFLHLQMLNQSLDLPLNGEQLKQIAKLNPLKLEDFKAIDGIGDTFISKYGNQFLETLNDLAKSQTDNNQVDYSIRLTLSELEKKLINLSKANRLLYLGRLSSKTSFDLYQEDHNSFSDFLYHGAKLELVNLKEATEENNKELANRYKAAHTLIKNIEKQQRETGQEDLYVGYPFVLGQFLSDNFLVRAPLALFPVKTKVTNNSITLQIDPLRDVNINTNLLVALAKANQDSSTIGEPDWEEVNPETFISDLLSFYQSQKLNISNVDETLIPFTPKKVEDFNSLTPGAFVMEPIAVLGHFPHHATSLQRDFHQLTNQDSIPPHLETLLSTLDENPDTLMPMEQLPATSYREQDLVYINALNASQEKAQIAIKKGHSIVIEGPPGTGKSQTITNIIADGLYDKKTILMVSEKKAAIDVVYSRLSNLNRYALILDNLNDKQRFYTQLKTLYSETPSNKVPVSLTDLNASIDTVFDELETLAKTLVSTRMIELYSEVNKLDYSTPEGYQKYTQLKELISLDTDYFSLKQALLTIDQNSIEHQQLLTEIPEIAHLNTTLRPVDILNLQQELKSIIELEASHTKQSFFKKLFSPQSDHRQNLLQQLFKQPVKSLSNEHIQQILTNYQSYLKVSPVDNKQLISTLSNVSKAFNIDIEQSKSLLLNFVGFETLDTFEATHRDLIELMDDFEGIINSVNQSHLEKAELIEDNLILALKENLLSMIQSKRAKEMERIIERKRQWPIGKFVNRFSLELFNGIKVWLTTPEVVSEIFPLNSNLFDLVIFDEASQMYIERAIPSIYRGKQVVIAGDSKQLRPSSLGVGRLSFDEISDEFIESTPALDEESLLDLARFRYPATLLNYHYRSVYEELIAFSNVAFYQNELVMSPAVSLPDEPVIEVFKVDGKWQDRANKQESQRVVELISTLLKDRKHNETLGVITFNATQRTLIEEDLEKACLQEKELQQLVATEMNRFEEGEDKSLFIKNIENVQGDERDIIIFSIAYGPNDDGKVSTNFGWLNQQGGENRLNVAITRAKRKIYVITSIHPSQLDVKNSTYPGPIRLREYLEYCFAGSEKDQPRINQILSSLYQTEKSNRTSNFEPRIETFIELCEQKGIEFERHLGLASYTIDLVVIKDNKYQLAIFFDRNRYETISDTRTRDLHQDNYLRSRGWKVKRVFMRDLYDRMESIIDEIDKELSKSN